MNPNQESSVIPPVRIVVGEPGTGKTWLCRQTALHQPRVLWFDPSSREQLSDGAFRSANPHSIARTIRGKTVFQGVYYPTGKSSRDGPGVVMKAAAQYPGRVHVVVDEFRLMVGRGRRTLPGFDEVVRTHRNSNLSIDFITHRLADTHPDAGVIVQRVIIFGASWPADRKKIKDDYGKEVLAMVDQLEQYQYVWICTRSGLTGVGGGRESTRSRIIV